MYIPPHLQNPPLSTLLLLLLLLLPPHLFLNFTFISPLLTLIHPILIRYFCNHTSFQSHYNFQLHFNFICISLSFFVCRLSSIAVIDSRFWDALMLQLRHNMEVYLYMQIPITLVYLCLFGLAWSLLLYVLSIVEFWEVHLKL